MQDLLASIPDDASKKAFWLNLLQRLLLEGHQGKTAAIGIPSPQAAPFQQKGYLRGRTPIEPERHRAWNAPKIQNMVGQRLPEKTLSLSFRKNRKGKGT